ncbi:MAG: PHP domain-containing protein [Candidatus Saganbacteria bacterium]|nr:PHP domain-containing protein [Candidatus Saganbacteria bacterium]
MTADLHLHSSFSDGTDSPEELVRQAAVAGLKTIALTDHDTLAGLERAAAAGRAAGVEVIPGLELTTEQPRAEVHILGYFIDGDNQGLRETLARVRQGRIERIHKIVGKLKKLKVEIEPEEVMALSGQNSPGRPHVARALVRKGVVANFKEAFSRYLDVRAPAYVAHYRLPPAEAVRLVRQAGGIPVFAHPAVSNRDDLIPELIAAGLRGLEVYYPGYYADQIEYYLDLARKFGLLVTGGSDYHGADSGRELKLGEHTIPDELADKLRDEHLRGN